MDTELVAERFRSVALQITKILEGPIDLDTVEGVTFQVEQLCQHALRISHLVHHQAGVEFPQRLIHDLHLRFAELQALESRIEMQDVTYTTPNQRTGARGRPKFLIRRAQLLHFVECGFTVPKMADMLGVSKRTIERRLHDESISLRELDNIVSTIQENFPNCGLRRTDGELRRRGLRIQQSRLRKSLRRVDPLGVTIQWFQTIPRRRYTVPFPMALWHIDGNHKLIRYIDQTSPQKVEISIDGYSRIPVFMKCSNNNRADTVLNAFLEAVDHWGLPSRVRSDKGGENVKVAMYMLEHPQRGPNRGKCGELGPTNQLELFALQFVFIPKINNHLHIWKEGWIRHKIRTANNQTPQQLFTEGLLAMHNSPALVELDNENYINYGIDLEDTWYQSHEEIQQVEVPDTANPLDEETFIELVETVNPMKESHNYGIDVYLETKQFLLQHL
eukprot:gene3966-4518_t